MPRTKSNPNHIDFYLLKKIEKLPRELITIIYSFTNKKIKLIFNHKWEWYLKNINFEFYHLKEFYDKILFVFNKMSNLQINNFTNMVSKYCPEIILNMKNDEETTLLWSDSNKYTKLFACYINEFIEHRMKHYNLYKRNLLSPITQETNSICLNFKKKQEQNNYENMPKIENILFLCKSILYIYSKYFSAS
jgi:hypothetical protein